VIDDTKVEKKRHFEEHGIPNHIGAVRFNDEELEEIAEAVHGGPRAKRANTNDRYFEAPRAPPQDVQDRIETYAETLAPSGDVDYPLPWWALPFCRQRDLMREGGIGIGFDDAESPKVYMFLSAKQSPFAANFLELRRVPGRLVRHNDEDPDDVYYVAENRKEFKFCAPFRSFEAWQLPAADDSDLCIYEGLRYEGELVCTNCATLDYDVFVHRLPPAPLGVAEAHPKKNKCVAHPDKITRLLELHPWLDIDDLVPRHATKRPHGPPLPRWPVGGGGGAPIVDVPPDAVPPPEPVLIPEVPDDGEVEDASGDEALVDVGAALGDVRRDLAVEEEDVDTFYAVRVLGGRWTLENAGTVCDAVLGWARSGLPKAWAEAYDFPLTKRFHFDRYGRRNARQLCREFVRRANFFCGMYAHHEDTEHFVYTNAMVNSYRESHEFLDWITGLDVDDPAFGMGLEVRGLVPSVDV
jgi:hypothetical protein